jgi:methionyl-tRNA formyltransferase
MPRPARLRLAFLGTPRFAVAILDALIAAGHDVVRVYSQPPRPAGRGQKERRSAVHERAASLGIEVATPLSLRNPVEQAALAALPLDAAVTVAYGLILPKPILDAPRLGCINVHASLLPRWRGAAPIQRAILAGDEETGVTIMKMDEGLDTGPMLLEERVPIAPEDTAETLHDTLAALGAKLIVPALEGLAAGTLLARPQPAEGITYAAKLTRAEGRLDWAKPAAALERQVRAFAPWPGAWFEHGKEQIKVLEAAPVSRKNGAVPGMVQDDALAVACGEGALRLLRVQRPGRAPMDAAALLRGFALPAGTRLGAGG